jgi:probable rRNA maturation factor
MAYLVEVNIAEGLEARAAAADLDLGLVEAAIGAVLRGEQVSATAEVGVLVADDAELQRLNQAFRGIDSPTDVLSFADDGAPSSFVTAPETPVYLGDIAISLDRVLAQAAEYGHTPARELAYLAAHGALHLLGYDHETGPEDAAAMRAREEAVMAELGLPRTP